MGENTNAYSILMGKVEDKRPRGRHCHNYEDNIHVYLKEVDRMAGT
jgi:hypothetical protein